MKCVCKKCGYVFDSVILDKQEAYNEIMIKSNRHIEQKHKELGAEMAKAMQLAMGALINVAHFNEFLFVPTCEDEDKVPDPRQKFMLDILDKHQEAVMVTIGYEKSDDEDEYEDDEEDEDEDETHELEPGTVELPTEDAATSPTTN